MSADATAPLHAIEVDPAELARCTPAVPAQAAAWVQGFGLFCKREGHRQGDVVCDEQLLAYISYRRLGNFTYYGAIIGHADHLGEGVMYKMHLDLIGALLQARDAAG